MAMQNRIKEFLDTQKLTQADLAKAIGTSPSDVSCMIKENKNLTPEKMFKISKFLRVPIEQIFQYSDENELLTFDYNIPLENIDNVREKNESYSSQPLDELREYYNNLGIDKSTQMKTEVTITFQSPLDYKKLATEISDMLATLETEYKIKEYTIKNID